ncbi:MAG: 16S rRNA (guanine(527)-N(7))-methyltransferase RsmG, partial [Deltaproteobacteria bacterium]
MNTFPISFFTASALKMGISLDDAQVSSLIAYYHLLLFWNQKINLFANSTSDMIVAKHFIDSLAVNTILKMGGRKVIDIGSGGGFPAIPLAIVGNLAHITLVEASRKKASFLREAVNTLQLANIEIVNKRIEDLLNLPRYCNQYDIVISRATLKLCDFIALGSPLLAL